MPQLLRRGRPENQHGHGHDQKEFESRVIEHGVAPARGRDQPRKYRRPQRAGQIGAAGNQGERRTAAAVEPAADINIKWRVDAADPDQPHEQAVPDIER
jgi:hypothetical protein